MKRLILLLIFGLFTLGTIVFGCNDLNRIVRNSEIEFTILSQYQEIDFTGSCGFVTPGNNQLKQKHN